MGDLFIDKNIDPMLLYETEPFDSDEYIFELKLDGIRCIAYIEPKSVVLQNKRHKDVTAIYPELSELKCCVKKRVILDGELVVLTDGKSFLRTSIVASTIPPLPQHGSFIVSIFPPALFGVPMLSFAHSLETWYGVKNCPVCLLPIKQVINSSPRKSSNAQSSYTTDESSINSLPHISDKACCSSLL